MRAGVINFSDILLEKKTYENNLWLFIQNLMVAKPLHICFKKNR